MPANGHIAPLGVGPYPRRPTTGETHGITSIDPSCTGFAALRWRTTISQRLSPPLCSEASWREDHRREANGAQYERVAGLAMKRGPSVDFCGYWQRHLKAA